MSSRVSLLQSQVREVPELQEAFDFEGFLSEGAPDVLPLLTRVISVPTTTMAFGQFVTTRFRTLASVEDDAFDRMCLQVSIGVLQVRRKSPLTQ